MIDNIPEKQDAQPRKEVHLDQWFKPFEDYAKTPLGGARYRPMDAKFSSKRFKFATPGVGKWAVTTKWEQESYEDARDPDTTWSNHSIVILPDTEKIISNSSELLDIQGETEKRLARLDFDDDEGTKDDDEWRYQYKNLKITLKLPSGRELCMEFSETGEKEDIGDLGQCWTDINSHEIFENVYIPDSENIAKQIQMKIEKIGGGEK